MKVRAAVLADAPALGQVMVEAWLAAHRGQMPDAAWRKRLEEWTPDVSARGWARLLSEGDEGMVLLIAEEDSRSTATQRPSAERPGRNAWPVPSPGRD